ncbi:MAG: DUF2891 domain-containing protein [Planctomycetes bacterium]|nr:DUF2891 domain-containing protein [Planctomycetota bacterium]MCB9918276.1 DUF2891 domain-containing protein [Planctomycetota bacterium]
MLTGLLGSSRAPCQEVFVTLDATTATRFARLALDCIHREYPNKISHVLQSESDVRAPSALTPVFYGCFDWHSAVHGHWLLVRLCRTFPDAEFAPAIRRALATSFRPDRVAKEVEYFQGEDRRPFERPYGLAWLLQLSTELDEWNDEDARAWAKTLDPLVVIATQRLLEWYPKLTGPIRTGEHSQTAFAMGLALDWARSRKHEAMRALLEKRGRDFYLEDRGWRLSFEPGGQDFLSPGLAEADFMRRILPQAQFAQWLTAFLPELTPAAPDAFDGLASGIPVDPDTWLRPAIVTDKSDGKLAHLDGLNLSRAWMLEGILEGLPTSDPRRDRLREAALAHRAAGLRAVTGEHYAGGHWLGSFAVYLVTQRGLARR